MKSAEPSTRTSKRSRGKASTIATVSDVMPVAEEAFVDPTAVVSSGVDDVDFSLSRSHLLIHSHPNLSKRHLSSIYYAKHSGDIRSQAASTQLLQLLLLLLLLLSHFSRVRLCATS